MKIIMRVPKSAAERLLVLKRYEDSGKFELCNPDLPEKENKLRKNQRQVDTVDEAADLIELGWHPRLWDDVSQKFNRITPNNVTVMEVPE